MEASIVGTDELANLRVIFAISIFDSYLLCASTMEHAAKRSRSEETPEDSGVIY